MLMNIYRVVDHDTKLDRLGTYGHDGYDGFIVASKDQSTDHVMDIVRKHVEKDRYPVVGPRWPYHNQPYTIEWLCQTEDIEEEQVLMHSWSSSG